MKTIELLTIGNEILDGDVVNTNSNYLCKLFTNLGGCVIRSITVRDDVDTISHELKDMLDRGVSIIVTTGGLGPTYDDMTLRGIAMGTGLKLILNKMALSMVKKRYSDYTKNGYFESSTMTETREKMAELPEGAQPLENFAGAAPGILLNVGHSDIICLPGVPAEIASIIDKSLQKYLKEKFGNSSYMERQIVVHWKDESSLAPLVEEIARQYPSVYVKSRPKKFGDDLRIRVIFSKRGDSKEAIIMDLERAINDFAGKLSEMDIRCEL